MGTTPIEPTARSFALSRARSAHSASRAKEHTSLSFGVKLCPQIRIWDRAISAGVLHCITAGFTAGVAVAVLGEFVTAVGMGVGVGLTGIVVGWL